ncbi:MAG: SpoIIE family protein phosphatase [Leptospiraceae bacterium]|nr:SpoIIE family protein phosphatase [Leptospiraceae bacterium]
MANPVLSPEKNSVSLAPVQESVDTWWVTDGSLDPAAAPALANPSRCPEAFPGLNWKEENDPRENPGKTIATDKKNPVVWYCRTFRYDGDPAGAYALEMGPIDDRDITYLNGKEIGRTGQWDSQLAQAYDRVRVYTFDHDSLRSGSNVLLVKVQGYSVDLKWGLYVDRTRIGEARHILSTFYAYNFLATGFLIAYFTVASYFLFLFLRRQKERENLAFAVFGYLLVVYQFFRTQLKYDLMDDFLLWKRIEYVVLFLLVPSFYYFVRSYFRLPQKKWVKILDMAMLVPGAAVLVFIGIVLISDDAALWSHVNVQYNQVLLCWPAYVGGAIGLLIHQLIKKDRDAYFMIGGVVVLLAAALVDSLSNVGTLNLPRLAGYAFAFFVLGLGLILANRFVRVNEQVEELNATLERKVEQRTSELQETLQEVRTLKVQQDGDYFLTSLLIHPLASVHVDSPLVHVESFARQKKKFQFKHRQSEIGGDINIAYAIELRGKRYIAFLNADAMGKSIQGAGGAIVIGTVFKSLVTRTQIDEAAQSRSPERWLKDCFKELQDVFCSFDGSMLISAVIGLLEEDSGFLLLLNAEHPWTVLYRNGEASFLEEEMMLRKLGVDGFDSGFHLRKYQLEPGDVLVMGSDGRDDLMLPGNGEEETDRFNEDHLLFLQHVSNGKGALAGIVESIEKSGLLTDDLSLLRVGFMEDPPVDVATVSAKKKESKAQDLIQKAERALDDDSERAYRLALRAVEEFPASDEILFRASRVTKKASKKSRSGLKQARDLADRVRIRSPFYLPNLNHLARLAYILGDLVASEKHVKEVLEQDPENEKARKLMGHLRERRERV